MKKQPIFTLVRLVSRFGLSSVLFMALAAGGASASPQASAPPDPGLYDFLLRFHGHTCAGSLMGARLGIAAKAALKAAGGEGKLKARYFDHSCPVDGIQVTAGTTLGNKAMEVVDKNEHRLILTAEKNGRQVETRLTKLAEEKAKPARDLSKKARALPAGSPERQRLEKEVEGIYAWFRTAPDAEVVTVRVIK